MSGFALKVKSKSIQQKIVKDITPATTILELKQNIAQLTLIKIECLHLLHGYPPMALDISNDKLTLQEVGLFSGDLIIATEKSAETSYKPAPESITQLHFPHITSSKGVLQKKVVPADNSCLFTSVGYVINGNVDTDIGNYLRQIIAQYVSGDTETYSDALLGKPNAEYCEWIQKSDSWGGAIEVSILSSFYGIEIAVVDTQNAIINRFGEDKKYGARVFLIFDGVHYDPLYLEPNDGGRGQTIFPSDDGSMLSDAEQLAKEARDLRQFTDVNKFKLRCIQCDTLLIGQVEAQTHARESGHTQFGET